MYANVSESSPENSRVSHFYFKKKRNIRFVVVCSDISLAQKMMRETDQQAVSRAFAMFFWELGQSEDAQLLGISFVQDMSTYSMFQMKFGMSQSAKMSARQKKAASLSQDAMPLKYGHFYIVDAPW